MMTGVHRDSWWHRRCEHVPYLVLFSRLCVAVDRPEPAGSTDVDRESVPLDVFVRMTKPNVEMRVSPQVEHVFEVFRVACLSFGSASAEQQRPVDKA